MIKDKQSKHWKFKNDFVSFVDLWGIIGNTKNTINFCTFIYLEMLLLKAKIDFGIIGIALTTSGVWKHFNDFFSS